MAGENTPSISFVATARNDDHGGNLLQRMQLCVNGLLEQCRRHQISAELILVEWNPPADKPRLAEALKWPKDGGPCSVRIIEVPPEIHRRFKHSDQLPLFQMIAKNVGIRRARGQFVLATNIDLIFPDELMQFLASGNLKADRHYRVDRYDVPSDVPTDCSVDKQLQFCRENVFRINRRDGTFAVDRASSSKNVEIIGRLRRKVKNLLRGPYRLLWLLSLMPNRLLWLLTLMLLRFGEFKVELRRYLQRAWESLGQLSPSYSVNLAATHLHTNACGDFALMAREQWFGLRGYPELEMYSLHIDSLLCYMAYHGGVQEHFLPYPIYHIEHGSGWSPERVEELLARMRSKGIPVLSYGELLDWDTKMSREHKPIMLNNENWGLSEEDLPEMLIYQAH
jgi:hypothetical protein